MKELKNFRQFLAEGDFYKDNPKPSPEALIKVFQDEIVAAKANEEDDVVPAYEKGIEMLKQGGDSYEVNNKVQDMYVKITSDFSYDPTVFIDAAREIDAKKKLNEGTWALGSVAEMLKVMGKLEQIRKMGAAKGGVELENIDTALYNVFGDDSFSDAIDAAKGTDDDDRFNNFIGDAQARAKELLDSEVEYRKERGETGMEFKPRFGLEENDKVLDEVSESMGIFREIDMMVGSIKDQMNPDDAFDSLVSEFEAISGGTKLLHRALKNISLDNNLGEIRSAYNEEKEDE